MTMDGVVDGDLHAEDWMLNQALGLEVLCSASWTTAVPSTASTRPVATLWRRSTDIDKSKAGPLAAPGANRGAGAYEVYLAMLQTLYSSASWPTLANFVDRALAGNATAVVNLADSYLGIKSDGTYDNSGDMNLAVNCLDRDSRSEAHAAARRPLRCRRRRRTSGRLSRREAPTALTGARPRRR